MKMHVFAILLLIAGLCALNNVYEQLSRMI